MPRIPFAVALVAVLVAVMQAPAQAQSSGTSVDRSTCLQAYKSGSYESAMPACERLVFYYIPRLQAMTRSNDAKVVLSSTWDLLRVTYVMAYGYKKTGAPEQGRQMALHCVGWGLLSLGALKEIDPNGQNSQNGDKAMEIVRDMKALNVAFPGVVAEETKAFQEAFH
jgi:hypothetical protein